MEDNKTHITRRQILVAGTGIVGVGSVAAVTLATNTTIFAQAKSQQADPSTSLPVKAIEEVFETNGTVEPGGILLIDLPRNDLHPSLFGVSVKPDIGFDTEITFQAVGSGAIVKWEFALLDKEVNPVLEELFDQNLTPAKSTLNALHNHFLEVEPEIKFLHGTATGDPVHIAKALRQALSKSATPFGQSNAAGDTHLPNKDIEEIIGGSGMVSDSVLSVSVERKETFRELGIKLQPAMQLESMFNFQSIGDGQAAEVAEYVVLPDEADAVARTLKQHGFNVTALHNHELFIEPNVYYLHAFATGKPLDLAHATRDALNHTNSKFQ